jgi:hypothetical protein
LATSCLTALTAILPFLAGCVQEPVREAVSAPALAAKSFLVLPAAVSAESILAGQTDSEKARIRRALSDAVAVQLESDLRSAGYPVRIAGVVGSSDSDPAATAAEVPSSMFRESADNRSPLRLEEQAAVSLKQAAEQSKADALVLAELALSTELRRVDALDRGGLAINLDRSETETMIQERGTLLPRAFARVRLAVFEVAEAKIVWSNTGTSRAFVKNPATPAVARKLAADVFQPFTRPGGK